MKKIFVVQNQRIDTKSTESERKEQSLCNMKLYRSSLENPEIFS